GCVIFYQGEIIHLCNGRPSDSLTRALLSMGLRESWQNAFRFHDLAFLADDREKVERELPRIRELAAKEGMRVLWSGYAVHIQPPGGGKGRGVREVARLLGVPLSMVAVVGDGENDLDMFLPEPLKACPGDADPAVKRVADIVARSPGGQGFAEIAAIILEEANQ
ncbi:MAG: HAD hydrolase family protein, partial [Desulfurococcales archaeon]|nr:HAD hydrolase family protein [Desulfurococcales archaeon]